MKILKKMAVCVVCLVTILALTGCAKVQYQRVIYNDGTIIDALAVKLDEDKIVNTGFKIAQVKKDIKAKMNVYINAIFKAFDDRNDNLLEIQKIAVKNNVIGSVDEKDNYIIASLTFKNYSAFKYFYGLHLEEDSESNNNSDTEKEFLFNKNTTKGKTIFSTEDAKYLTNSFIEYFRNNFSEDDAELSYVFATPESKLHSNATYHYEIDGIHYHEWDILDADQEINTYTIQFKPVNWYVIALISTVVLVIILFIIALFKNKKQKGKPILAHKVENPDENNG